MRILHPETVLARGLTGLLAIRGRWLLGVRAAWVSLVILCLALFATALPARYGQLTDRSGAIAGALARLDLSSSVYATVTIGLDAVFVLVSFGIAGLLLTRSGRIPMALFVAVFLVAFAGTTSSTIDALARRQPAVALITTILGAIGYIGLNGLFYLFPDGRFVPRWTRIAFALAIAGQIPFSLPDTSPDNPNSWPAPVLLPLLLAIFGSMIFAQIYRYRRVSGPVERHQIKWVLWGGAAAIVLMFLARSPAIVRPLFGQSGAILLHDPLLDLGFTLIPLAIGISALRYRLWDIDVIISRTLVYAGLTALVAGLYILIVAYLGTVLRVGHTLPVSLVATGAVAIVFHPVRQWLQHGVNRLIYGERDDPYTVLSRLGAQLEAILAPDAALPAIVDTVAQTLKLPYVAIVLAGDHDTGMTVSRGTPTPQRLALPLIYGADAIGQLIVGHRPGETGFSPADRRLLTDLVRQAGVAAYSVRLTADLQRARERLVTAREEERRRLRRDLHDGLGPALSALSLRLGAARNLLPRDPARADAMLGELIAEVATAVGDIRRLVYGLRPPSLDDLGLAGALRAYANQLSTEEGQIAVRVEVVGPLAALPAAIEVAAYRITQEALTNMTRHAKARSCRVNLQATAAALRVEIVDDGIGLPPEHRAGVGLVSMRERAEELGGTCRIESMPNGGTHVIAELPFPARGAS